ncbi:MAG TPA: hypothetical protein VMV00_01405 [Candidatus Baltobacteraceae bacterium]|nr:hypothetical protein [Candidatus Baltobacteraceae bacterium]
MPKSSTFTIPRQDLRRILVIYSVSEKNIQGLFASMEKAHRHINVISFAALLEKAGVDRDKSANILRRLGMDDIAIRTIFNMVDEQKISAETGRVYNVTIDFS